MAISSKIEEIILEIAKNAGNISDAMTLGVGDVDIPSSAIVRDIEVPEEPELPDVPLVPLTPEVPEVPDTPDVPEVPAVPEVPDVPLSNPTDVIT